MAGDPLDERVGHDLALAALVPVRTGVLGEPGERREDGHALAHRQQRRHIGHRIRRRTDRHPPLPFRPSGALGGAGWVETLGHRSRRSGGLPVTHLVQSRTELGIDGSAVLDPQVRGLARHTRHPPLRHLTALQGGEALRHLVDQRLGQPEQSGSLVRGLHPGEGDLVRDAAAEAVLTPARLDLLGALRRVEGNALGRLRRCKGILHSLHRA
nr:hypothetical protein [Tetrasphaera sp. F2B08]